MQQNLNCFLEGCGAPLISAAPLVLLAGTTVLVRRPRVCCAPDWSCCADKTLQWEPGLSHQNLLWFPDIQKNWWLLCPYVFSPKAGGWTRWSLKVPSNTNHADSTWHIHTWKLPDTRILYLLNLAGCTGAEISRVSEPETYFLIIPTSRTWHLFLRSWGKVTWRKLFRNSFVVFTFLVYNKTFTEKLLVTAGKGQFCFTVEHSQWAGTSTALREPSAVHSN